MLRLRYYFLSNMLGHQSACHLCQCLNGQLRTLLRNPIIRYMGPDKVLYGVIYGKKSPFTEFWAPWQIFYVSGHCKLVAAGTLLAISVLVVNWIELNLQRLAEKVLACLVKIDQLMLSMLSLTLFLESNDIAYCWSIYLRVTMFLKPSLASYSVRMHNYLKMLRFTCVGPHSIIRANSFLRNLVRCSCKCKLWYENWNVLFSVPGNWWPSPGKGNWAL